MSATARDALWQSAFDGLQEAVWVVDVPSRTLLFANLSAARLVGMPRGDLKGISVMRLAATPEDQCFWAEPSHVLAQGIHSFSSLLRADGALVSVERKVGAFAMLEPGAALLMTMRDCSAQQATERELESLLSQLRATLDSAADGMLVCDLAGGVRAFNQRLACIWGMPQSLLMQRNDAAVHAFMAEGVLDPSVYLERLSAIAHAPQEHSSDILLLRSGQVLERRSVPQMHRGTVMGRVYSFRDITDEVEAQAGLRLASTVFDCSPDAIFIADDMHRLLRLNPACERLLGSGAQQLQGSAVAALFGRENGERLLSQALAQWQGDGVWRGDLVVARASGAGCAVHLSWVPLRGEGGSLKQSIGFMRDLTEQHAAQKRIDELAYSDVLTGLPNRLLLSRRVEDVLRSSLPGAARFAVLFLDLDRFKVINDSLGHAFGDRVLQLVAARLQSCLRQADMLCRLGGDEFLVYLHGGNADVAEMVARRMLDEMRRPFTLDGMGFSIQCSMGVAMYPQDGDGLDDLIKHADSAMYRVKERGRGNYGFYQPQMNANLLSRMKLEHAMRQALDRQCMAVHYQPQIHMESGRIVGAEALLRWTDPELGPISPGVFVPLAEESGYIVTLGAWVLAQAVQQSARWMHAGTPLPVSVNVSALEFRQPDFVERLTHLLALYALPPSLLELELTESILLQDAQEAAQRLAAVAALGVALAIDDFGTGYSSLAYLKKLPIRKLKVDQSFVRGLPNDEGDLAIVTAIAHMGRALRMQVVAEGVETEAQRAVLQQLQCDHYQGFLYSPAVTAADFGHLLKAAAFKKGLPQGHAVAGLPLSLP
ncbi:EAL domain-containing protein [Acidovorax sp. SRB_14]|uniref:sensor domain-containing protein n=1 Tax=Acidovorax sp. SRB_14 TaxID=1962699 RepID=UPI00352C6EC5